MILTWYIFRQTLSNVTISTLVFVGIIWLSQSFKSIKLIVNKGANLSDFFILSAYSIPSWLLIAIPFGIFAGCMISYLKLQNDREILVMRSAGISNLKLSIPAILTAILSSLILFMISHFVMPKTYKNFKNLQNEIRNSSQRFIVKDNIFGRNICPSDEVIVSMPKLKSTPKWHADAGHLKDKAYRDLS